MQIPIGPCLETDHCRRWNFCRLCAPDFALEVLNRCSNADIRVHSRYEKIVNDVKAEIALAHHEADECDEKLQCALHDLAAHSSKPED